MLQKNFLPFDHCSHLKFKMSSVPSFSWKNCRDNTKLFFSLVILYLFGLVLSCSRILPAVYLQSQTRVVGTLELDPVSPIHPNQCWKMCTVCKIDGSYYPLLRPKEADFPSFFFLLLISQLARNFISAIWRELARLPPELYSEITHPITP